MGWSGSITSGSAVGTAATYSSDTTTEHAYSVGSFKAPKKGIYRFQLYGSGGKKEADRVSYASCGEGGQGGYTDGYLLLEANQVVYVGAGGVCSAAFASSATGSKLSAISASALYFVAGAGGGGGAAWDARTNYGDVGGAGGGTTGGGGSRGGTQTAGGSGPDNGSSSDDGKYGAGATGGYGNVNDTSYVRGDGGDGYYGGGAGTGGEGWGQGGGGGSGYVKTASITYNGKTYTSTTTQGGGMASNTAGRVIVTYYAASELPVSFNGTKLTKIIFNGTEVGSLVFNGTKIYFKNLLGRWRRCLRLMAPAFS